MGKVEKARFCAAGVLVNSYQEFKSGRIKKDRSFLRDGRGRRVLLEAQLPGPITDGEGQCGFEEIGAKLDEGDDFAAKRCALCEAVCFARAIDRTPSRKRPKP